MLTQAILFLGLVGQILAAPSLHPNGSKDLGKENVLNMTSVEPASGLSPADFDFPLSLDGLGFGGTVDAAKPTDNKKVVEGRQREVIIVEIPNSVGHIVETDISLTIARPKSAGAAPAQPASSMSSSSASTISGDGDVISDDSDSDVGEFVKEFLSRLEKSNPHSPSQVALGMLKEGLDEEKGQLKELMSEAHEVFLNITEDAVQALNESMKTTGDAEQKRRSMDTQLREWNDTLIGSVGAFGEELESKRAEFKMFLTRLRACLEAADQLGMMSKKDNREESTVEEALINIDLECRKELSLVENETVAVATEIAKGGATIKAVLGLGQNATGAASPATLDFGMFVENTTNTAVATLRAMDSNFVNWEKAAENGFQDEVKHLFHTHSTAAAKPSLAASTSDTTPKDGDNDLRHQAEALINADEAATNGTAVTVPGPDADILQIL